ncbi:DUF6378 domain-containing protein [Psychrobacter sp. 16-MNA-CIBAN-0192]|uniref:DUF6378 domain-containing protein n=1 Tax=Psychrobacter sp. 16-MNA-CIBAN-0192 TaxID=3140448 RepID=UPI00332BC3C2
MGIEIGSVWVNKRNELHTVTVTSFENGVVKGFENVDGCSNVPYTASKSDLLYFFDERLSDNVTQTHEPYEEAACQPKAVQILNEAVQIMSERGKSYDKTGNNAERSMPKIVAMFNALTGHELTPTQGWKFMACVKLARSEQGEHREDNYLDGAAYFALAGEEAGESDK